jgi:hypothetical protein
VKCDIDVSGALIDSARYAPYGAQAPSRLPMRAERVNGDECAAHSEDGWPGGRSDVSAASAKGAEIVLGSIRREPLSPS